MVYKLNLPTFLRSTKGKFWEQFQEWNGFFWRVYVRQCMKLCRSLLFITIILGYYLKNKLLTELL